MAKQILTPEQRERKNAKMKEWNRKNYLANKERIKAEKKAHYHSNKEAISIKRKARYKKGKHNPVVYLLADHNYVGVTTNITNRMYEHKNVRNRCVDYRVLAELDTLEEALELEALLHSLGYEGKHAKSKTI